MREQLATYADATVNERLDFYGGGKALRTYAKRYPEFVYSAFRSAALIHRIAYVELNWWRGSWGKTYRLVNPRMIATSNCGMRFFLNPDRARTCEIPKADAVHCGRCNGQRPSFAKIKPTAGVSRRYAQDHLGCITEAQ